MQKKKSTYRYRIRFFIHTAGLIVCNEKRFDFKLPTGYPVTLSCLDNESITKGKEFVLSGGGYRSVQEAQEHGHHLKKTLLVLGPVLQLGIDAGKDIAKSRIGSSVCDKIFDEHGVKVIENVHGLSVYSEEHPVLTFSASTVGLAFPSKVRDFAKNINTLFKLPHNLSEKETLCLELYGASHFENSERTRFITLVLAVEALLDRSKRHKNAKKLVDSFLELTKNSDLSTSEKSSITGSLRWLYYNSISQSLKELAKTHIEDKKYGGISAPKFILKCYDARSKLVHNGKVNEEKIDIGSLAAQLEIFIADLIKKKIGITST